MGKKIQRKMLCACVMTPQTLNVALNLPVFLLFARHQILCFFGVEHYAFIREI